MALAGILSIPFSDQKFTLVERQEFSRQANGITLAKSFGSALWSGEWTTGPLPHDEALDYEALLNSLDGAIHEFYAHDLRRPYPRAHPNGDFTDSGKIATVGADGKSLSLKSLPAGLTLSRGDYLAFDYGSGSRALHQVMANVTAGPGGATGLIELRPHLRPGAQVDAAVSLKKPSAKFILLPGSIDQRLQGGLMTVLSFSAIQRL